MKRRVRWAYVSDLHAPHTNQQAFKKVLGLLERHAPEVLIVGGDWIDAESASPYPNEGSETILDEYRVAVTQAKKLREVVSRKTKLVRLVGNHEDRMEAHRLNIPKRLRDAVHWTNYEPLAAEWGRWLTVPYVKSREGAFVLGQCIFYHGWDSSDELEALQFANLCGGDGHRLCVRGHTHTPVAPTQARRSKNVVLPFWYANAGHVGPGQPPFMRNKDVSGWGRAMLLGDANPNPVAGKGVQWTARLERLDGG